MEDPIMLFIVFVLGLLAGYTFGFWHKRRGRSNNCQCTHPESFHSKGGECQKDYCQCTVFIPADGKFKIDSQDLRELRKMAGLKEKV
jgi:hypothetical protein